jgi:hypothetical protein
MEEKEAIDLLGKLKSFMENTSKQIETLIIRTHNLQVDLDKLKKYIVNENKIIVRN